MKIAPKELLIRNAQECQACGRMSCSRRVLSELNGNWQAEVMFVAEAPGRLGAEVTGIPLFGDRTGDRFDVLLKAMGIRRSNAFITNAILCNPRNADGNNDTPRRAEIVNCSSFLKRTIQVVNPKLVVALGRIALEALGKIEEHGLTLSMAVGKSRPWNNRKIAVLYHPGPRTQIHRPWNTQILDAAALFGRRVEISKLLKQQADLFAHDVHNQS